MVDQMAILTKLDCNTYGWTWMAIFVVEIFMVLWMSYGILFMTPTTWKYKNIRNIW